MLASSGVKQVIYVSDKHIGTESNTIAKKIFTLAGIEYKQLTPSTNILTNLSKHLQDLVLSL
jgi:dCMP deaminase